MKTVKPIIIAAVSIFLVWLLATAFAQEKVEDPGVSTEHTILKFTGDAELLVDPDYAVITIGVETNDKNIRKAKRENDSIIDTIITSAEPFVTEKRDIRIDYVKITRRYKKERELKGFLGYFIKNKVIITIKDLSKYNDCITAMIESGVDNILDITFKVSDFSKYKNEVRVMAMKAAHNKARVMANAIGQDIGPATFFKETKSAYKKLFGLRSEWDNDFASPFNISTAIVNEDSNTQVAVGKTRFTASVEVDFIFN
jgi:uncharacterized protein YggE